MYISRKRKYRRIQNWSPFVSLVTLVKEYLSEYDSEISTIKIIHGPNRAGDIPHSLASIEKAIKLLN